MLIFLCTDASIQHKTWARFRPSHAHRAKLELHYRGCTILAVNWVISNPEKDTAFCAPPLFSLLLHTLPNQPVIPSNFAWLTCSLLKMQNCWCLAKTEFSLLPYMSTEGQGETSGTPGSAPFWMLPYFAPQTFLLQSPCLRLLAAFLLCCLAQVWGLQN